MGDVGLTHLVAKKVPDSVHQAGHEPRVAEQHADKPGGPEVLSGEKKKLDLISQTCAIKTRLRDF